jgi:sulfite oxidase
MRPSPIGSASRRDFLRSLCAAGFSLGLGSREIAGLFADEPSAQPAGKRLVVRSANPFNAEPPLDRLAEDWITPLESFYVRNHGETPRLEVDGYKLSVEGLVDRPLRLSLAELGERFPAYKATATLTCAGNRRSEFTGKKIGGVQWGAGAIGNADWSGVSLASVLRHAGIQAGAKHVWFEGADVIVDKAESYPFGGSIALDKALAAGDRRTQALLATKMNDKALTAEHGAPLRAVVPGFIGARSVKWLKKIVVSDRPSPNHYLAAAYKLIAEETPAAIAAAEPLYEFAINSVICQPSADSAVSAGALEVHGYALPAGGEGRTIRRVELSVDGGNSWIAAKLISPVQEFCWALWSVDVSITAPTERLLVRATDSAGQTQPREMPWNAKGYQYNAWHQVKLTAKKKK